MEVNFVEDLKQEFQACAEYDVTVHRMSGEWVEGWVRGDAEAEEVYYFQAKVFDVGSIHGIHNGRVSKLAICQGMKWDDSKCVYNYDRGLDDSKLVNDTILYAVILELEQL